MSRHDPEEIKKANEIVYKADFLWPHEQGTLEDYLYEFANAHTEEYRKIIYDAIKSKFDQKGKF
jgi:hypothetical protein